MTDCTEFLNNNKNNASTLKRNITKVIAFLIAELLKVDVL